MAMGLSREAVFRIVRALSQPGSRLQVSCGRKVRAPQSRVPGNAWGV